MSWVELGIGIQRIYGNRRNVLDRSSLKAWRGWMRENLENIKSEGGWGLMGEELTKLKLFKQISRRVRSGYVGGR